MVQIKQKMSSAQIGNAFARDDFVVKVAQFAALNEKIHEG